MGSFDYTCGISGLPIGAGTAVRFALLTQNPYKEHEGHGAHYLHDWWFLRTFPLRGEYNDYGSVVHIDDSPAKDLWTDSLPLDVLTRGYGDNCIHDVATSPHMSFADMMDAVQEGRLRVKQDVGEARDSSMHLSMGFKVPAGVPTLKRVTARLSAAGLPFFDGNYATSGYLVDNRRYGTVRVRWHGMDLDEVEQLRVAQNVLRRYATVIKAGSGSYANKADLLVHVKPGTKDFHGRLRDAAPSLRVSSLMVREDVWQALLQMPLHDQWSTNPVVPTIQDFYDATEKLYELSLSLVREHRTIVEALSHSEEAKTRKFARNLRFHPFQLEGTMEGASKWISRLLANDVVPFTVGLSTHWGLFVQKGLPESDPVTIDNFLHSVAETAYVRHVLMQVRFIWTPSSPRGAQFGEFDKHATFLKALAKIADDQHANAVAAGLV